MLANVIEAPSASNAVGLMFFKAVSRIFSESAYWH